MTGVRLTALAALLSCAVLTSGCRAGPGAGAAPDSAGAVTASGTQAFFDASRVGTVALEVDPDAYTAMVTTYRQTGEKQWLHASVTIDGTRYEECWRGFNTHWHDDGRRRGDVVVRCLRQ